VTLRVALLGKFPPTCGQVSTLDLWMVAGLAERGVEIAICSDALFPRKRSVMAAPSPEREQALKALLPGVEIDYAGHLSEKTFLPFSELGYVSYLAAARETVLRHRPDVILSHYLEPYALAGGQLAAEFGIPHVVTHAGSDIVRLCADEAIRSLYSSVLSKAAYFVPKSRIARDRFGGDAPVFDISPYMPDPRHFGRGEEAGGRAAGGEPLFGFYGKFVHGKGLDKLIAAFRAFRERHGKGRLVLIGGDIGGAFAMASLLDPDLDGAVEVRGFVPNWEIPQVLRSLTCLVYTKGGYRVQQHAAIVLREAVACGTPVIATEESLAGSPSDLLRFGLIRFIEADGGVDELVEAMAGMAADPPVAPDSLQNYFADGYERYVDSWHRCLAEAAEGRAACAARGAARPVPVGAQAG
jgi:glycosyltransferase involved in cell wall biosynthesis